MAKEDTTLPVLAHVLALFTGFIGPLIILLVAKDKNSSNHSKYALNWQLSLLIYVIISVILVFIYIGIFLLIALVVLNIVFCILAAVKAGENELWAYPLAIPFFRVE